MANNFRSLFRWLTPAWLHGTGNTSPTAPPAEEENEGELVLYALTLMIDGWIESLRQGLDARLPTRASASANRLTGIDRGIVRGRDETNEHYAERLVRWRYPFGHRVRGNAFSALEQMAEYFGGELDSYNIDVKGNRRERASDGSLSYSYGNAWNWDGAGSTPRWARSWFVMDLTGIADETPDFGDADLYGGALGTLGYCVGMTGVTPEDMRTMRKLFRPPRPWKPAGTRAEWLIVSLDGSEPAPDGTWLYWWTDDAARVPARDPAFRYVALYHENSVYEGDETSVWPVSFTVAGGAVETGDPTATWPASITLTDGDTYDGDASNTWPVSVLLYDDGDLAK